MNIYLLTQNILLGYDTYDSCVVIAKNREDASMIHPSALEDKRFRITDAEYHRADWPTDPKHVTVKLLGPAVGGIGEPSRVVCASYNAG